MNNSGCHLADVTPIQCNKIFIDGESHSSIFVMTQQSLEEKIASLKFLNRITDLDSGLTSGQHLCL